MTGTDPAHIRQVDVHTAARMRADGAILLDVREDDEWAAGHADGATHVPLSKLDPASLTAGETIVALCRSGNRSAKAAVVLAEAGFDVVNVTGGMKAWQQAGLPVATDQGKVGTV